MRNFNIKKIRKKLDKLDDKLLLIVKKRMLLVNQVIKTKTLKKQIIDKKRINVILKRIKNKSLKMGVDKEISRKIWKTMIRAFIDYEFKNFKKK
tara:strand:- start:1575 stop:1856 length:282 start_codon:yes stop_codon:yes gene_type:complete